MNEMNEKAEATRARDLLGHNIEKDGGLTRYVPRYGAPLPYIDLLIGEYGDGGSARFTPAEARQLAAALVKLADEIEGR